jgi:periplasmic divalent cation tolerance protein
MTIAADRVARRPRRVPLKAGEISVAYFWVAFRVRRVSTPGPDAPLIVFVTVPDVQAGASLARVLVGEQLAACVNILPGARSIYAWKGEIKDEGEALCLVKTRAELFPALEARLCSLHPYEVPEILGVAPALGSQPYLRWLAEATGAESA